MKIFESGIELNQTEALLLGEEVDNVEQWILSTIRNRIQNAKYALHTRWVNHLENDPEIHAYPKRTDDLVALIISRPYFKTRKQLEELEKNSTFMEI